jgi:glutaredoxin-like protein NrdH
MKEHPVPDSTPTPAKPTTVYSKPACVQCNGTYRGLMKRGQVEGVDYVVVDVTEDEAALAHVLALGYQQVPVVETETEHWSGYRPDKMAEVFGPLPAAV